MEKTRRPDFAKLARLKAQLLIETNRKTSNLLEGEARSIYRGRSMDFDELREYVYGDNVRDIDWKSSSRAGKTLVRTYMAHKKNNVLFVCDAGKKMQADLSSGEDKTGLAMITTGALMYLVDQHGDDYAMICQQGKSYAYQGFSSGIQHFETLLSEYQRDVEKESSHSLNEMLQYVTDRIHRQMIIFVITDIDGIANLNSRVLKELSAHADVMFIDLDDAYLFRETFDIETGKYEEILTGNNNAFLEEEYQARLAILRQAEHEMKKYRMSLQIVRKEGELIPDLVQLFEKHRNAN